jgi:hypothetical protein
MRRRVVIRAAVAAAALFLLATQLAPATVKQDGNVRITLLSLVQPHLLPRHVKAPIAVFLSGHVDTVRSGGVPPQLQKMTIDVNRHGSVRTDGLPVCEIAEIQPSSTERALQNCGDAIVGSGQFWAHIVLPGQEPYPTHGRLLVFNGRRNGERAILAHIYTAKPFPTSFVIPFGVKRISGGPYGTRLTAAFPDALGDWGFVDRIKLTLRRKYERGGKHLSYFNANCPALPGTRAATFDLASADFAFGDKSLTLKVRKSCGVKGR